MVGLASGTNQRLVEVLRGDSEVLARIQDDFSSLLRSYNGQAREPIEITCVYEEIPMAGVGEVCDGKRDFFSLLFFIFISLLSPFSHHSPKRKRSCIRPPTTHYQTYTINLLKGSLMQVVPKQSAMLPGYTAIGIHANHRDIARFSSETDPGFITIVKELQRWTKNIQNSQRGVVRLDPSTDSTENIALGPERRNIAGIVFYGDILHSNVVQGGQVIHGDLRFGE